MSDYDNEDCCCDCGVRWNDTYCPDCRKVRDEIKRIKKELECYKRIEERDLELASLRRALANTKDRLGK